MPGLTPNPESDDSRGWMILPRRHDVVAPDLDDWCEWSERARALWAEWWSSPMAVEWLSQDASVLERLLVMQMTAWGEVLVEVGDEGVWMPTRVSGVMISEMRMLGDQFGLTPSSRRRLRWMIEDVDPVERVASEAGPGRMPGIGDLGLNVVKIDAKSS